jgi:Leucine-rich repeat (LRR) protein
MRGGCDDQKKMLLQQEEEEDEAAAAKSGQNKGSCGRRRRRRRKDSMNSPPSSSSYVYQILHLALLAVIIFFFHTFSPTFSSVQSSLKLKASTQQQFSCLLAVLSAADPTLISATTFLPPTSQQQQQQQQQLPSISGSSAIDEQALLEFKQAVVQGSGNLLASWVVGGGSSSNLCSWEGVVCDPEGMGRVVGLLLPSSALVVSYLPAALGNLSELVTLNLSNNNFNQSHIPVELSLCSKLEFLDLSNTNLSGSIPPQLGNSLFSLKVLKLGGNMLLNGSIPDTFANLRQLAVLDLSFNQLSGSVPLGVWKLPNLVNVSLNSNNLTGTLTISPPDYWGQIQFLDLGGNYFIGEIPAEIGNLKALQVLVLAGNQLVGNIPQEISGCVSLQNLTLGENNFTGPVPEFLVNLTSLVRIDLGRNNLTGFIPLDLDKLGNLSTLILSSNELFGPVPASLGNCSSLVELDLASNNLTGEIPPVLGQLSKLNILSLKGNNLIGGFPPELCNCTMLEVLDLGSNQLTGTLPDALGNLTNLVNLILSDNQFTGPIPIDLNKCLKLQGLSLGSNHLSGVIPQGLSELSEEMRYFCLSRNNLTGPVPDWLGNFPKLQVLDLHMNQLNGSIPASLSNLSMFKGTPRVTEPSTDLSDLFVKYIMMGVQVRYLLGTGATLMDLSDNLLSGEVPPVLGNLTNMLILDLSGNNLTGSIPASLGDAHQLNALDLSGNGLSGHIPDNLTNLYFLVYFNVSHNHLSGEVPLNHQFETFDVSSYFDNDLCGYYLKKQANSLKQPCQAAPSPAPSAAASVGSKRSFPFQAEIWIPVSLSVLAVLSAVVILYRCMFRRWRDDIKVVHSTDLGEMNEHDKMHWLLPELINNQRLSINCATFEKVMFKLTVEDIVNATNNFDPENIIGDGGFGFVYRATLKSGMQVAVKKLFRHRFDGDREFLSEMQTLGKIKHRNLVSLLGYCSVGEDRFLVYKFMEHGSLESWIHRYQEDNSKPQLTWQARLDVARGAARGLAFLHHVCIPHVIHRDIKASNILLDEKFEAQVADFGLARLISVGDTHVSTDFAGTVGYIPPEYSQCSIATTKGDVYSFGIVLLELATGQLPTYQHSSGDNLVTWVHKLVAADAGHEALDPSLDMRGIGNDPLRLLEVGCECTLNEAAKRPTMQQVVRSLDSASPSLSDRSVVLNFFDGAADDSILSR